MLTHIIYIEVVQALDHSFCARLPRDEVRRQVLQLIGDYSAKQGMRLPGWEIDLLARQLIHDLPCLERSRHADWEAA